ncbi:MerR family DNA-binding transcriptional regulator, partial [Lacticaseibacillus rhamnosus]
MHPVSTLPPGKYRIGVVARLTGISPHALRVWERRDGTFGPARAGA